MNEIRRSRNIITILNEIDEKTNSLKKIKTAKNSHEFLFFPVMDIKNKFKISNKFDRRHSKKFLQEKDECLEVVELDDKFSEIQESPTYKIPKINPLNITFGK